MPQARGFVWAIYVDDLGVQYALKVDADSAADPNRGWSQPAPTDLPALPRQWIPRVVFGNDPNGHRRKTRIGTTAAPLWNGAAQSYQMEASDGTLVTVTVVGRFAERRTLH